ncbi:hypothetical protein D3C77_770080 [compost metagenome]
MLFILSMLFLNIRCRALFLYYKFTQHLFTDFAYICLGKRIDKLYAIGDFEGRQAAFS